MFEFDGGMFSILDLGFEEMGLRKDEIGRRFLIEVEVNVPKKLLSLLLLFFGFIVRERERERFK